MPIQSIVHCTVITIVWFIFFIVANVLHITVSSFFCSQFQESWEENLYPRFKFCWRKTLNGLHFSISEEVNKYKIWMLQSAFASGKGLHLCIAYMTTNIHAHIQILIVESYLVTAAQRWTDRSDDAIQWAGGTMPSEYHLQEKWVKRLAQAHNAKVPETVVGVQNGNPLFTG